MLKTLKFKKNLFIALAVIIFIAAAVLAVGYSDLKQVKVVEIIKDDTSPTIGPSFDEKITKKLNKKPVNVELFPVK